MTNQINKQSQDIQQQRLDELKRLFPDLFDNEGNLNEKELKALAENYSVPQAEKFVFQWAGKQQSKRIAFKPSKATLQPNKDKSLEFDKTKNLIIEGDNLEVLKLMQKSYFNKIKCIYIDPPYNTGNDFIYTDNFSDSKENYWEKSGTTQDGVKLDTNNESKGRYHSDWLNMMQSRLLLARNLLKEDGVIFVSIDDNEVHNLRKLMDEVFGEENFVAQFSWRKSDNQANIGNIARVKEYIVCFAKNFEAISFNKMKLSDRARKEYRYSDKNGNFRRDILLHKTRGRHTYEVKTPSGKILNGPWMIKEEKFEKLKAEDKIYWTKGGDEQPYGKLYLKDSEGQITNDFLGIEFGTNQQGSLEVERLLEKRNFDFPKPVSLIKHFLTIATNKNSNDLILDFFAGSGTTAQAVMELNKEDGGNRKFILVQIPEKTDEKSEAYKAGYKTIADICIERVKRAGEKIKKEDKDLFAGNKEIDLGFKVYSLAGSRFVENTFKPDPDKTEEENVKLFDEYLEKSRQAEIFEIENVEGLLYEIAIKDGFDFNFQKEELKDFKNNRVYHIKDKEKEALVCLDENLEESTVKLLSNYKDKRFICLSRAVDTTKKWNLRQILGEQMVWVV